MFWESKKEKEDRIAMWKELETKLPCGVHDLWTGGFCHSRTSYRKGKKRWDICVCEPTGKYWREDKPDLVEIKP